MADPRIQSSTISELNSPPHACTNCTKIHNAIRNWTAFVRRDTSLPIAPWQEIEDARACPTCCKITADLTSRPFLQGPQPHCVLRLISDRDGDLGISCEEEGCPEKICIRARCTKFCVHSSKHNRQPATKTSPPHQHGSLFLRRATRSAVTQSAAVDIAQVRQWLLFCDSYHRGLCRSPAQSHQPPHQTIFINVKTKALSIGTIKAQYAALSYVWGNLNGQFRTLESNYKGLQESGALTLNWQVLPATVKDAIILTEQLDLTFLWVDRLCIVQDAETTKQDVSRMASIYTNAYITIVAASGMDAEAGLFGHGTASSSQDHNTHYHFLEQPFSSVEQKEEEDIWHTRAWTFQERAVSRRSMIFFQGTYKFECQEGVYYEESKLGTMLEGPVEDIRSENDEIRCLRRIFFGISKGAHPRHNITIVPWPNAGQLRMLSTGFSGRTISKDADLVNAFSAILDMLSPSFPGGFFYAIPEFIFDAGITWQHVESPGKRRKMFPSWSWLGWEGGSRLGDWDATARPGQRTLRTPLVRWQKRVSETRELVPIDNSYYEWERFAIDAISEPPDGWVRTQTPRNDGLKYTSNQLPQEQIDPYSAQIRLALYQPVPVGRGPPVSIEQLWDPLLFGMVTLVKFTLGEPLSQSNPFQLNIYDTRQQWAGIMIPSSSDVDEVGRDNACSVIAVCRARRARHDDDSAQFFEEMDLRSELATEDPYEFIQVLWVVHEDKVASRRGTGRVKANIWEEQVGQEIDIVLG